jgi:hypothetical protein
MNRTRARVAAPIGSARIGGETSILSAVTK